MFLNIVMFLIILGVIAGGLVHHVGIRPVSIAGFLLMAAGLVGSILCTSIVQLYFTFGILTGCAHYMFVCVCVCVCVCVFVCVCAILLQFYVRLVAMLPKNCKCSNISSVLIGNFPI